MLYQMSYDVNVRLCGFYLLVLTGESDTPNLTNLSTVL